MRSKPLQHSPYLHIFTTVSEHLRRCDTDFMATSMFNLFLAFLFAVFTHCIEIEVLNENVVYGRETNSILLLRIHYFNDQEFAASPSYSKLCLTIDARTCKCYHNFLVEDILLPSECISDESFWFAFTIVPTSAGEKLSRAVRAISTPLFIPSRDVRSNINSSKMVSDKTQLMEPIDRLYNEASQITLVLPVILDDLSRCAILLNTLQLVPRGVVREMLIFVPDHQYDIMTAALHGLLQNLTFEVSFNPESAHFRQQIGNSVYPYAIQMALKLLVAKVVKTEFYLTLDADIILRHPFEINQILAPFIEDKAYILPVTHNDKSSDGKSFGVRSHVRRKAIYDHECRSTHHPAWWNGSEALLYIQSTEPEKQGFGVTPALLSTFGSLLTLATIQESMLMKQQAECSSTNSTIEFCAYAAIKDNYSYCDEKILDVDFTEFDCQAMVEYLWLKSFGHLGTLWSEYTLYRTILDHYQVN